MNKNLMIARQSAFNYGYHVPQFTCCYLELLALLSHGTSIILQAQLDEQLAGLQTLTAARRSKLEESIKLHQYLQEVEEVLSWLADKEATASSDDYGKDFEHLLVSQTDRVCISLLVLSTLYPQHSRL